jgi:methyl-accepting chemotaxis protein
MRLGSKLLLPSIATAVVALGCGAVNSLLMNREAAGIATTYNAGIANLRAISGAQEQLGRTHASVYRTFSLIGSMDDAKVQAFRAEVQQQVKAMQKDVAAVAAEHSDKPELTAGADKLGAQLAAYGKQADQAIDLASVDPNTGVAAMQTADEAFKLAAQDASAYVQAIQSDTEAAQAASTQRAYHMALALGTLSLVLTGLALTVGARVLRRLVQALSESAQVAEAVAQGDLSPRRIEARSDEIGDLQRSLAQMVERLRTSLLDVRHAASNIASASAEIATGNQDLSHRTEQAASNLQQTSSSMEHLTASVRQSADAASQANQLASSASAVAERGGTAVAQVVSTMEEINVASRKIADIIGVIDGIAFQTNILALNAAVEAARAGEQGRGFAVVAGEVRSLAGRSADAAREIKALIGASVDKVESGTHLVQGAGTTMGEIVASVRRVTDIVGEITAGTAEQRDGIGQVNTAVSQLDQMTQQNAALVEQSAAAADSMRQQAQRLSDMVAGFKLGTEPALATPAYQAKPASVAKPPPSGARPAMHERAAQAVIQTAKASARAAAPPKGASQPSLPPAATPSDDWESF